MSRSTRSGRSYLSPPVSPQPQARRSSTGRRASVAGPRSQTRSARSLSGSPQPNRPRRTCSSSTEGDQQSVSSIITGSVATGSSSRGTGRKNKSRTNDRGLDVPFQKQVLQDIQQYGGLATVLPSITTFCNYQAQVSEDNLALYGTARSKERFRVDNKIRHWKKLPKDEFEQVLKDFGVPPLEYFQPFVPPAVVSVPDQARSASAIPAFVPSAVPSSSSAVPSSTPSSASLTKREPVLVSPPPYISSLAANLAFSPSYRDHRQASSDEDEHEQRRTIMTSKEKGVERVDGVVTEYITVDIENPELTSYPFKVKRVDGLVSKTDANLIYEGVMIEMRCDIRDAMGVPAVLDENGEVLKKAIPAFKFRAKVLSDDKVLVESCLLDFTDRGNDDPLFKECLNRLGYDKLLTNARDISRNNYANRVGLAKFQSAVKHYVLDFQGQVKLSSNVLALHKKKKNAEWMKLEAMTILIDLSQATDQFDTIRRTVPDKDGKSTEQEFLIWKQMYVPVFFWRAANLLVKPKPLGDLEEESSDDADEGVAAMQIALKGARIGNRLNTGASLVVSSTTSPLKVPEVNMLSSEDELDSMDEQEVDSPGSKGATEKKMNSMQKSIKAWTKEGQALLEEVGKRRKEKKRTIDDTKAPSEKAGLTYASLTDERHEIASLPPEMRAQIVQIPAGEKRTQALHGYLNQLLFTLPVAVREAIGAMKPHERVEALFKALAAKETGVVNL